jgi:heavy metal translocating P-type ATPase
VKFDTARIKLAIACVALLSIAVYLVTKFVFPSEIGNYFLLLALVIGFLPLLVETLASLARGNFGVDVLALLSISGSLLLGEYLAGVIIVLMLSGGEILEDFALKRSRKELSKLLANSPRIAHLMSGGQIRDLAVEAVQVDAELLVKAGEIVPVDAKVMTGTAEVDESSITGESLPVTKNAGDVIYSGSVLRDKPLKVMAIADAAHSKYQQIVALVQQAESQKAPFVRLADRYSVWFTALAVGLTGLAYLLSRDPATSLSVLVVATPCPLILATPIAFSSGISIGARRGIVFKSGSAIEQLAKVTTIVFDKTGTLTVGSPVVTQINLLNKDLDQERLLAQVAAVEQLSQHLLGRVLGRLTQTSAQLPEVTDFSESFGSGVTATVMADKLVIGGRDYLRSHGVTVADELTAAAGKLLVLVAVNGRLALTIELADQPKPDAKSVVNRLQQQFKRKLLMLTGDRQEVAAKLAADFEIADYQAECRPEQKLGVIKKLQGTGARVAMVGDGVNDAPALAGADVGVALGYLGSSASTEAADVVITVSELDRVELAIKLSERVLRIANQVILIGIGLSTLLMLVATAGFLTPVAGAMLQEVIDVTVIVYALRVRSLKL